MPPFGPNETAVLWRRTSFGSQSQAGSTFVARLLTVVTTLRAQNRSVLEYMTAACLAARATENPPHLYYPRQLILLARSCLLLDPPERIRYMLL